MAVHDVTRIILTIGLLVLSYKETGWATCTVLALIAVNIEAKVFLDKIEAKKS